MALKNIVEPPEVRAKKAAEALNLFLQNDEKQYDENNANFQKLTGINSNDIRDPRSFISAKMIQEAQKRSSQGKEGAVTVIGDPKNQNTCAAGVCTLAANAGISFNGMTGSLGSGLATDSKGRKIPQYNPLFRDQFAKAGYVELGDKDKPEKGDIVQYFENDGTPAHLELVTNEKSSQMPNNPNAYETFNNYGLFNSNQPVGFFQDNRANKSDDPKKTFRTNGKVVVYRLSDQAADKAIKNLPKEDQDPITGLYKSRTDRMQKLTSIAPDLNNEDKTLMYLIAQAKKQGKSKEYINSFFRNKSKDNKDFFNSLIDNL